MYQNFEQNIKYLNDTLRVDSSFDIVNREILIGERNAVFYFVDENEISVFYCWKFYHFDYHSIKRVEPYYGLSDTNMTLGRSKIKVKLVTNRGDIYISPSSRDKFLEVLKERRKGKTFKG